MAQRKNNFSEENFMAGFGVGLAAGAVGMFLFGTDEGTKIRKELKDHWKEAAADLLAEGVIENAEQDLWGLFKDILDKAGEAGQHQIDSIKKSNTATTARKTKKKNQFKGV